MTPAQIAANQRNAQLSTGPRTAAGKAASSRNASFHGLRAANPTTLAEVVLAHEDSAEFEHRLSFYKERFSTTDPDRVFLVEQLVAAQWRLARVQRLQRLYMDYLAAGSPEISTNEPTPDQRILQHMLDRGQDPLITLFRYETTFDRRSWRLRRALDQPVSDTGYQALLSASTAPPMHICNNLPSTSSATEQIARTNPIEPESKPATPVATEPPKAPAKDYTAMASRMSDLNLSEMIADLRHINAANPKPTQARDAYERELIQMGPASRAEFLAACLAEQKARKTIGAAA
jgi:hypothetical protein